MILVTSIGMDLVTRNIMGDCSPTYLKSGSLCYRTSPKFETEMIRLRRRKLTIRLARHWTFLSAKKSPAKEISKIFELEVNSNSKIDMKIIL